MAHLVENEVKVTMSLQGGDDPINSRTITFKAAGGSIQIGRSSKTQKKALFPADDNMWIDNPVISRNHAILSVCGEPPKVFLEDNESSHGTYIRNKNIKARGKTELENGDEVQFGDHVLHKNESFKPPVFRVGIEHTRSNRTSALPPRPIGRSISVPDETDDEESEMDESNSDVESVASESSEVDEPISPHRTYDSYFLGSQNNPVAIDDEPRVVVDLREPSEDYEPVIEAINAPTFDKPGPAYDVGMPIFESAEPEHDDDDDEEEDMSARVESPVYQPPSPARHVDGPAAEAGAAPYDLFSPDPSPPQYTQGPFAQPIEAPVSRESYSIHESIVYDTEDVWASPKHIDWEPYPPQPLPMHRPNPPPPHTGFEPLQPTSFIERSLQKKNDMSIHSLINPLPNVSATAGSKRKADELEVDEVHDEVDGHVDDDSVDTQKEATTQATEEMIELVENRATSQQDVMAASPANSVAKGNKVQEVAQAPPTKRRRITSILSHVGVFMLGAASTVGALAALPDGIFE